MCKVLGRKESRGGGRGGGSRDGGRVASLHRVTRKSLTGKGSGKTLSLCPCVHPSIHSYMQHIQGETLEGTAKEATAEFRDPVRTSVL